VPASLMLQPQIKSGGTLQSPTAAFANSAIHNADRHSVRFEHPQDLIPPTPAFSVPGVGPKLRPYQTDILREIWRLIEAGTRRLLLPLPTGGGKTVIAASLVAHAVSLGWRVLILAHRRELITQTSAKLHAAGVDHGIVQAGFPMRPGERVQVASVQTISARAMRSSTIELPAADLVIVDEAACRAHGYATADGRYCHALAQAR